MTFNEFKTMCSGISNPSQKVKTADLPFFTALFLKHFKEPLSNNKVFSAFLQRFKSVQTFFDPKTDL